MLKRPKAWRAWIVGAAALLALVWIVEGSQSYQSCIKGAQYEQGEQTLQNRIADFAAMLERRRDCLGAFVHANEGAITALATLLIALFTLILWRSTDKFIKVSEDQIAVARDAAIAATNTANAAVSSLRLAKRGFLSFKRYAVHRIGNDPNSPENTGFAIIWFLENVGNAPVIVTKTLVRWRALLANDASPLDWDKDVDAVVSNTPIGPKTEVNTDPLRITLETATKIFKKEIKVFVLIRAEYGDMFDREASYHTQSCYEIRVLIDPAEIFRQNLSQSQYITISVVGEFNSAI